MSHGKNGKGIKKTVKRAEKRSGKGIGRKIGRCLSVFVKTLWKKRIIVMLCGAFILSGCSDWENGSREAPPHENGSREALPDENLSYGVEPYRDESCAAMADEALAYEDIIAGEMHQENKAAEPEITEVDWSAYFDGLNGAAVLYDSTGEKYILYNEELAMIRRSPCSTFKIISSLVALEEGIIEPEHSVRTWSGEVFWNENWNHDIDFQEAFQTSCVWYFREVVDEIGEERMLAALEKLQYGNCDISDWEGRLNTNNNNPALTGFWIESSLAVSPKEQTETLARIFENNAVYAKETKNRLKQVILVSEQKENGLSIYGKTGMGKAQGIVVDAWFTGFAETSEGNLYFCVYLGQSDGKNVSSAAAKEIALQIVSDYFS